MGLNYLPYGSLIGEYSLILLHQLIYFNAVMVRHAFYLY